jgi:hypothetical protein
LNSRSHVHHFTFGQSGSGRWYFIATALSHDPVELGK